MPPPSLPGDAHERERRRVTRQILFFARLSFVIVGTMPWWLPLARAYLPVDPLGAMVDHLFVLVCHRQSERTIELAGVAMPLCSRCVGIFSGLALGAALCWPRISVKQGRIALLVAGLIMLADVIMQDSGIHPMWHSTRVATGALLGWIASAMLMAAIVRERSTIRTGNAGIEQGTKDKRQATPTLG